MKKIARLLSGITVLLFLILAAQANDQKLSTLATIGVSTPILDNGTGVLIGINPSYTLTPNLSIESQVSYSYTFISSTFLSGNQGKSHGINVLVGGRLYLNSSEKINRFYVNLLIGGNYFQEQINGLIRNPELGIGVSAGVFYHRGKFVIGLSSESPENLTLKLGYSF